METVTINGFILQVPNCDGVLPEEYDASVRVRATTVTLVDAEIMARYAAGEHTCCSCPLCVPGKNHFGEESPMYVPGPEEHASVLREARRVLLGVTVDDYAEALARGAEHAAPFESWDKLADRATD